MLEFALLVLTLNPNGEFRTTVSPADDHPACLEQLAAVTDILAGIGTRIVHISCGQTSARLTPFEHGKGVADEIYKLRVTSEPGQFTVAAIEGGTCTPGVAGTVETFCTVSSQHLLDSE